MIGAAEVPGGSDGECWPEMKEIIAKTALGL
jgi:hypothetical protein